jgi:hypothetical protein
MGNGKSTSEKLRNEALCDKAKLGLVLDRVLDK